MMTNRPLLCALVLCSLCLAACSSNPDREGRHGRDKENTQLTEQQLRQEADKLYRDARKSLDSASYSEAITKYDKLIARYPFSDYGTQGELERIFAQYKSYQYDDASSAADRFLRDHPRHPKADYVQYLKGLIDFDRSSSFLDFLPIDTSRSDVNNDRLAFNDFALLIQKYPSSRYVADARKRMIYLRDRIASHELSIVSYYQRRGAYLAAAKRAQAIIADFPGAPATAEALRRMRDSYQALGLKPEAEQAAELIAANPGLLHPEHEQSTPTKTVLTQAPAPSAMPAANAEAPAQKGGVLSWFAGLFSRFDTSKPENTYTLVIPSGDKKSEPADGSTGTAAADTAKSHHLSVSVGPDDANRWHPEDEKPSETAKPADAQTQAQTVPAPATTATPTAPATAPTATPPPPGSSQQNQAAQAPEKKKGWLTRFADLFSIFDHTTVVHTSDDQADGAQKTDQTDGK